MLEVILFACFLILLLGIIDKSKFIIGLSVVLAIWALFEDYSSRYEAQRHIEKLKRSFDSGSDIYCEGGSAFGSTRLIVNGKQGWSLNTTENKQDSYLTNKENTLIVKLKDCKAEK